MNIPDPCLPNHHPQQRNYFVACFIISIFQGELINGIPIKVNTAKSYLTEVDALLNARQIRSPQCADVNLITNLLDAQRSWESQPNRCNPISDKRFRYAGARLRHSDPDSAKAAICNWLFLGRHTGYHKSEWCQDTSTTFATKIKASGSALPCLPSRRLCLPLCR